MTTIALRASDPIDVEEAGSCIYECDLAKEDGTAVAVGDLDFLRVTLYDLTTDGIINSRDAQSILNVNGGTFAAGHLELVLGPDDHPIVTTTPACAIGALQLHKLLLEAEWDSGAGAKRWEKTIRVRNLGHVS